MENEEESLDRTRCGRVCRPLIRQYQYEWIPNTRKDAKTAGISDLEWQTIEHFEIWKVTIIICLLNNSTEQGFTWNLADFQPSEGNVYRICITCLSGPYFEPQSWYFKKFLTIIENEWIHAAFKLVLWHE